MQSADRREKIGLLGGTFDPVHNGHLAVAGFVLQTLALDSILFIPAALPPHKSSHADGLPVSSFADRYAMLEKAIAPRSVFRLSDIEAKRAAPSYSIDTIAILAAELGEQVELFFIIGADAFLEIETWKRFRQLPTLANFVVISRPGSPPSGIGEVISRNFSGYTYDPASETWDSPEGRGTFILRHMEPVPVSSTLIRLKVRSGESISGLVPRPVEDYIRKHELYHGIRS